MKTEDMVRVVVRMRWEPGTGWYGRVTGLAENKRDPRLCDDQEDVMVSDAIRCYPHMEEWALDPSLSDMSKFNRMARACAIHVGWTRGVEPDDICVDWDTTPRYDNTPAYYHVVREGIPSYSNDDE